ncbi:MAG TPA: hypothetical protein VMR86_06260 [Myxococcota bacterium]|nr:hypothetical protein [Myxococcota bacterium]
MTPAEEQLALEQGGPAWRIWLRTGLAPTEPKLLVRRALLFAGICWLPLLVLSARDGLAMGDAVRVPFLRDFSAYARFLFAVVLLVLADAAVPARLRRVLLQFREARLIPRETEPGFVAILQKARRHVDSTVAELVVLALAVLAAWSSARRELGSGIATWQALIGVDGMKSLTVAGWWHALVSVPLFQFLFLRWGFRLLVWAQVLARISRLDLRLVATHPDRAAGLGFMALGQSGFAILVLVGSASLASVLAEDVVYRGATLQSLYPLIGAFALLALVFALGPLLAFTPRLAALKREALYEYGALSSRHDAAFRDKWLTLKAEAEELLGNEDASSLADLTTGYERAKALRPVPIDLQAIAPIILAAALPMIPLIALQVPLVDILKGLARVLM